MMFDGGFTWLRQGTLADGWKDVLEPVVARYRERDLRRYFRADAAIANPDFFNPHCTNDAPQRIGQESHGYSQRPNY
jgi:hypothetical protein